MWAAASGRAGGTCAWIMIHEASRGALCVAMYIAALWVDNDVAPLVAGLRFMQPGPPVGRVTRGLRGRGGSMWGAPTLEVARSEERGADSRGAARRAARVHTSMFTVGRGISW